MGRGLASVCGVACGQIRPTVHAHRMFAASLLLLLGGCSYQRDESAVNLAERGRFGPARERVAANATSKPEDRNFILDQMKLVTMGLAEGVPDIVEPTADRLYDRLRTQGLNDDNRFAQVLLTEGSVKIYKGDPFEQALAYYNIAVLDGMKGDWGNMRAASQQSLFLLRDFSKALQESGKSATSSSAPRGRGGRQRAQQQAPVQQASVEQDDQVALVRAAAQAEKEGKSNQDAMGIDYTPIASDFEIGYILKAIAARQLGEHADMTEALDTLRQIAPRLSAVADLIATGSYNTVFVVDYGMAPEKYGTGPDNAIAARTSVTPSDGALLSISVSSAGAPAPQASTWPVTTDVNRIATSTKWANLEDVRVAKSTIGTVLLAGGLITAVAADDDDGTQQMVGLIVAGVGALMKATSAADVRHNELFPQRTYIALADLGPGFNRVELAVGSSRMIFPQLPSGGSGGLTLHYVRMPTRQESWAASETLRYGNDVSGDPFAGGTTADAMLFLPYILGGRDVRTPSLAVLQSYQSAGFLKGFSLDDLQQLYRDEEIEVAGMNSSIDATGLHILDGGSWLYTPQPGSTGFKRLFYGNHPPYRPRSKPVKVLHEQIAEELEARRAAQQEQPKTTRVESRDDPWNQQGVDRGIVSEVFGNAGRR
jgi:hypothetical protein